MKPKVFLSHSKKDRIFIEKVANDLKKCGIESWYDDWEIQPGESIRNKIFKEGISSCDLFFTYLTKHSISSSWVIKELDAAFTHELKLGSNFTILFVDEDQSRELLPIDLRSLNIPAFNKEKYEIPFGKLIHYACKEYYKK